MAIVYDEVWVDSMLHLRDIRADHLNEHDDGVIENLSVTIKIE